MTGTIDPALFGMPDATTTGPQAGVTLTPYTGPMAITTPGPVIDGKIITGEITIAAANVTISNCVIQANNPPGTIASGAVVNCEQIPSTTIKNCTLIGDPGTGNGILGSGTFINNDISHTCIGI